MLSSYGAPTHRLEEYMSMSSRALEIEARFSYIPDCMTIGLDPGPSTAHPAEVELVRVSNGTNLGRQQDVHDILMDVTHDRLGVEEAARRLDEVLDKRPKFEVCFFSLDLSMASAPFAFEGRLADYQSFCYLCSTSIPHQASLLLLRHQACHE
ncbi:hypothetical protein E4U39_004608 [Claviceps sp. Clav50 group G5]|nr:hypothetical protein E4U39_004608 [Claviceps sp. Clav50 group G5]